MKTLGMDKICFAAALLLAATAMLVFNTSRGLLQVQQVLPDVTGEDYVISSRSEPAAGRQLWPAPQRLARDKAWTYDVFTPPEIFYDPNTRQFRIIPPQITDPAAQAREAGFGLELVEVLRVPFRLQLVGYVGGENNYLGTFENLETSETFLARAGRQIPSLHLTIRTFVVKQERGALSESLPVTGRVAYATVRDEQTGQETVLNNLERSYTRQTRARLRSTRDPAGEFEVGENGMIQTGGASYRIEKIRLAPESVDVTIMESDHTPQSEHRTLLAPVVPPTTSPDSR